MNAVLEDLLSMGDETYARLDVDALLRIYRDMLHVLGETIRVGEEILEHVDELYQKR